MKVGGWFSGVGGFELAAERVGFGSLTRAFDSKNYSNVQEVSAGSLVAFAQNQRDEVRDLGGVAGALAAEPGMKQQTYVTAPQVRRLTPLECERLQGFPDGWTDIPGNSDTQRYRQMGNAVAVPVVEWIMRRIADTVEPPTGGGVLL